MKSQKLPFGAPVAVTWVDSMVTVGWKKAAKTPTLEAIRTIGYTVASNDDALTVTTSIGAKGLTLSELTIPWVAIQEFEELHGPAWDVVV